MNNGAFALAFLSTALLVGCNSDTNKTSQTIHQQHLAAANQFSAAASRLNTSMAALCQKDSTASLETVQLAWAHTMQSWMPFQGREKGSEAALALSWQIQFWPDKKNTTGRKLSQLLKQDNVWTVDDLTSQSVAVQGLGAVEWFLYDNPQALQSEKGCQLAEAVTTHVNQSGNTLVSAWQENPWQTMTPELALGEYLGALNNQLDYSIKKLQRPMGKPGTPKPYQAESWRSGTSMMNLKTNVTAMQQLYLADGYGLDQLLRHKGYAETADRLVDQFTNLLATWPKEPSMTSMLKSREGYRQLIAIFNGLEYIQLTLQDEVAPELGIVVGFNATDGD
ncbi:imelysin family protein [Photobacterium sp. DNB23_23_1]|uniref:Imelysin family protein n=1 Tax=Photobacterium pectinilyticum TaxID=2906793 RepID=A0ABT1MXS3_9GAMM|nr:imelysin family protein [Photobacterium sp. ZSDE20]MCQ1057280.1 imelysin family protein [Photobacterium sp. ZSDE20]MDD1821739.1 imelysin family protein [Photobacterium sp. ZSDE20]